MLGQLHIRWENDYDKVLSFSRITPENWMAPDRKGYRPLGVMHSMNQLIEGAVAK
jgi:hypothetical protein